MKAIHIVKTQLVWQVSLEKAVSTTARNKVILGCEITYLLCHLEAHGASLWGLGVPFLYPTAPLSWDTGTMWTPGSPIQESPIPCAHRCCYGWSLLYPAETRVGMVAVKHWGSASVSKKSQEYFTQVSPMLIEILTYWHCHCMAEFSRKHSNSTAAASFYWHGHTWTTIRTQEMKQ